MSTPSRYGYFPSKKAGAMNNRISDPTPSRGQNNRSQEVPVGASEYFEPAWYIPKLDEMKRSKTREQGSVIQKVVQLTNDQLLCIMVGQRAYDEIIDKELGATLLGFVKEFQERHLLNFAALEGRLLNQFPAYDPVKKFEDLSIVEGSLSQALRIIMKDLVPLWMLPKEKADRNALAEKLSERMHNWKDGEFLLGEYASTPFSLEYLSSKTVSGHFTSDKKIPLLYGIAHNLMYFIMLYVVHVLRLFVRVRISPNNVFKFYSIDAYNKDKERRKEQRTTVELNTSVNSGAGGTESGEETQNKSKRQRESSEERKPKKSKRSKHEVPNIKREDEEESNPGSSVSEKESPTLSGVSAQPNGRTVICIESDEEMRADHQFDLRRVKPEKTDLTIREVKREINSSQTVVAETGSVTSSHSESVANNLQPLSELQPCMDSIEKDPHVLPIYKDVFRMLFKRATSLQEKNVELSSENATLKRLLEQHDVKTEEGN